MKILKLLLISSIFFITLVFAENKEVDTLVEKVNQALTPQEKKELIEQLKVKLAEKNRKAREEADAIIKAKQKMPQQIYTDTTIKKK